MPLLVTSPNRSRRRIARPEEVKGTGATRPRCPLRQADEIQALAGQTASRQCDASPFDNGWAVGSQQLSKHVDARNPRRQPSDRGSDQHGNGCQLALRTPLTTPAKLRIVASPLSRISCRISSIARATVEACCIASKGGSGPFAKSILAIACTEWFRR